MSLDTLCGIENELALCLKGPSRHPSDIRSLMLFILQQIQQRHPSVPCKDGSPTAGLMLQQGSRIYIEAPDPFLEIATAEVRTPHELLAYQRAAERLVRDSLPQAVQKAKLDPSDVTLLRIVTDHTNEHFCGAHANVSCRSDPETLTTSLLPFLATCPWGKAGGVGASGFVLSHKAKAILTAVSADTRAKRPILNIKKSEPLSGTGTHRIHCTSMDATMSEWGVYLLFGTLMVIARMLDDGVCVGPAMTLVDPVRTFRDLDTDPFGQRPVQLSCGLEVRPVDIQRYYLESAERYIAHQPKSWMHQFVQDWRTRHDEYEHNPAALSDKLDPFIKLRLFNGIVRKHGFDFEEFPHWCFAISILTEHLDAASLTQCRSREFCRERLPFVPFHLLDDHCSRHKLSWSRFPHALDLWWSLRATDMDYHRVTEDGLFWRMRRSGAIRDQIVDDAAIRYAMQHPPSDTRAKARGQAILEVAKEAGAVAHWDYVSSSTRKMRLSDPFSTSGTWEMTLEAVKAAKAAKAAEAAKKGAIR